MMPATLQPDLFAPETDDATTTPDATTTTDEANVLYRCAPCERTTRRSQVWRRRVHRTTQQQTWTDPIRRTAERFTEITWTDDQGRTTHGPHPPAVACPSCRRPTSGQTVRGRFSALHRCDARCIYAKGPECECSCGGKNHGAGHAR